MISIVCSDSIWLDVDSKHFYQDVTELGLLE